MGSGPLAPPDTHSASFRFLEDSQLFPVKWSKGCPVPALGGGRPSSTWVLPRGRLLQGTEAGPHGTRCQAESVASGPAGLRSNLFKSASSREHEAISAHWPATKPSPSLTRAWSPGDPPGVHSTVTVFCGCRNTLPHTWWLKTREIYSLIVLGALSPKSRYSRETLLPGENPSSLFGLQWLTAFLGLCCITPTTASVFTWPSPLCVSPLLTRTLVIGFRVHLVNPG